MNIVVLGATGFVGQHLVSTLLSRGHRVTAVARDGERARSFSWINQVQFVQGDMYASTTGIKEIAKDSDAVVDLIWPGLPNYMDLFHFESNLPASYSMLKSFVEAGVQQILVAGTCLEYGLQNGCLSVDSSLQPNTPYAFAKNALHSALKFLQTTSQFCLQWARLFYTYGEGQNPKSLLPLLDSAIDRGDDSFPMSGGEQLRDFLSIHSAVNQLTRLVEQPELTGDFNICSGQPKSVRRLVEEHLEYRQCDIDLEFGRYPYPEYEAMAFWGKSHPELMDLQAFSEPDNKD